MFSKPPHAIIAATGQSTDSLIAGTMPTIVCHRALLLLLLVQREVCALVVPSGGTHARSPRRAHASTMFEIPFGVGVTIASGLAILLRPESALWELIEGEPEPSEAADHLTASLCRSDGWEFKAEIGPEIARSLGGDGMLASSSVSGSAEISLQLRFDVDERFRSYPQGTATLLRPSRFLSADTGQPAGLWSVEVDDEGGVPSALELRLQFSDGIELSGETLVPAGAVYYSAQLAADEGASRVAALTSGKMEGNQVIRFGDGRVTVKETGAIGMATGLYSLKVIGSFVARPAQPRLEPATREGTA